MLHEDEIVEGMALHLDPDVLEAQGATYTCSRPARVQGWHMFLCVKAMATSGTWVPLYSRPSSRRKRLPKAGRTGDDFWRNGTFHYWEEQVWAAPHAAVVAAAAAGKDRSTRAQRNMLAVDRIPRCFPA